MGNHNLWLFGSGGLHSEHWVLSPSIFGTNTNHSILVFTSSSQFQLLFITQPIMVNSRSRTKVQCLSTWHIICPSNLCWVENQGQTHPHNGEQTSKSFFGSSLPFLCKKQKFILFIVFLLFLSIVCWYRRNFLALKWSCSLCPCLLWSSCVSLTGITNTSHLLQYKPTNMNSLHLRVWDLIKSINKVNGVYIILTSAHS